jgi:NAD(P)-dependent dehydrogenase (short-subunit alcohol dehydrogenase family)
MTKTIVITGASNGIGAAAARRLAADGHRVVIVGRSPAKTRRVAQNLGADFYVADFSKLSDVWALAVQLRANYTRIDVLAHNAGAVFGPERCVTLDAHEVTFQVNYLASFLLTKLLLDRLIESRATVMFTSSTGNRAIGHIDIGDLESKEKYSPLKAYCDSKLAQIIFARELNRRYRQNGLSAVAFHPGKSGSNVTRGPGALFHWMQHTSLQQIKDLLPGAKGPNTFKEGAETLVFLAEGDAGWDFPSGAFFLGRRAVKPNRQVFDAKLAKELWDRSEIMISLSEALIHADCEQFAQVGAGLRRMAANWS